MPNVTSHTNALTTEITSAQGQVNGLLFKDSATDTAHRAPLNAHCSMLNGVYVQMGSVPNTDWPKGTLGLSAFTI